MKFKIGKQVPCMVCHSESAFLRLEDYSEKFGLRVVVYSISCEVCQANGLFSVPVTSLDAIRDLRSYQQAFPEPEAV